MKTISEADLHIERESEKTVFMGEQQVSQSFQRRTIQLQIVSEDEQNADIGDLSEVGQDFVDQLRQDGFDVNPSDAPENKGKKGPPIFDILVQIPQFIHDNRELLFAIFDSISLVLQCLLVIRERRNETEKAHRDPIEITLHIDGRPVVIKVNDVASGMQLLESFRHIHPNEIQRVTPQSTLKIRVKVPKKKRRHSS